MHKRQNPRNEYGSEVVVGISGASGAIYGKRLVQVLTQKNIPVRLVVTNAGEITLKHECNTTKEELAEETGALLENDKNIGAKSASGSANIDAVVLCPCSGTTLGKLKADWDNLITRSAIVALKERRKLILVPREAPYATVHLENMHKLSQWGAIVIPASPGFYNHPQSIDDMVDFVVARILDHIGVERVHRNTLDWG